MARAAVFHVAPDDSFDDWIVRSGFGRELGHYPTREEAELAAEKIARDREADLIITFLTEGLSAEALRRDGSLVCSDVDRAWSHHDLADMFAGPGPKLRQRQRS